jgi:tetratricopeptide (TPR) repeat protein
MIARHCRRMENLLVIFFTALLASLAMAKYTNDDVKYLADCLKNSAAEKDVPFAVLTGAGTSCSAGIPLANQLVSEINNRPEFKHHLIRGKLNAAECEDYGLCMGALSDTDRRLLLEPHLKGAKLNWSNLGIANLLKSASVNRILTFNFDNVLQRASGVLGDYLPIYDYSIDPPEDVSYLPDKAVVHLHGQGYGLVMLNSKEQTGSHAKKLKPLLIDTLAKFNLIVVGYSGEADQCFEQLSEIYRGQKRLFWLSHDLDIRSHVKALQQKGGGTFNYFGGVDSDRFMIELGQELGCWPPKILHWPEEHVLEELEGIIPYPEDFPGDDDLKKIRVDLDRLAKIRRENSRKITELLQQGKYEEVIRLADTAQSDDERTSVAWAYTMHGNTLSGRAQEESDRSLLEESFTNFSTALNFKSNMYEALFLWGNAALEYATLNRDREPDPELFELAIEKLERAVSLEPRNHEALNNLSSAQLQLSQLQNNSYLLRMSIANSETAHRLKPHENRPLSLLAFGLSTLASWEKNSKLFKHSFVRYRAALRIKPDDHVALLNWGDALRQYGKMRKCSAALDQSILKYEAALQIKPERSNIFNNYAASLLELFALWPDGEYLSKAKLLASRAEQLSNKANYNLACVYARQESEDDCRMQLRRCKADGTLPSSDHLLTDADFTAFLEKDWFMELLA